MLCSAVFAEHNIWREAPDKKPIYLSFSASVVQAAKTAKPLNRTPKGVCGFALMTKAANLSCWRSGRSFGPTRAKTVRVHVLILQEESKDFLQISNVSQNGDFCRDCGKFRTMADTCLLSSLPSLPSHSDRRRTRILQRGTV
jgi:hypothetical protein